MAHKTAATALSPDWAAQTSKLLDGHLVSGTASDGPAGQAMIHSSEQLIGHVDARHRGAHPGGRPTQSRDRPKLNVAHSGSLSGRSVARNSAVRCAGQQP